MTVFSQSTFLSVWNETVWTLYSVYMVITYLFMFGRKNEIYVQCRKIDLNLCLETKPVTAGADGKVNVWDLYKYSISGTETRHIPLHPLQPLQSRYSDSVPDKGPTPRL